MIFDQSSVDFDKICWLKLAKTYLLPAPFIIDKVLPLVATVLPPDELFDTMRHIIRLNEPRSLKRGRGSKFRLNRALNIIVTFPAFLASKWLSPSLAPLGLRDKNSSGAHLRLKDPIIASFGLLPRISEAVKT